MVPHGLAIRRSMRYNKGKEKRRRKKKKSEAQLASECERGVQGTGSLPGQGQSPCGDAGGWPTAGAEPRSGGLPPELARCAWIGNGVGRMRKTYPARAERAWICHGVGRIQKIYPVRIRPTAFLSGLVLLVRLRLTRGALPHSPLVALPPDPCQGTSPLDPALAFAR